MQPRAGRTWAFDREPSTRRFDWSLALLVAPIVLLGLVGAVLSLFRRKPKKPQTPYRSNARS